MYIHEAVWRKYCSNFLLAPLAPQEIFFVDFTEILTGGQGGLVQADPDMLWISCGAHGQANYSVEKDFRRDTTKYHSCHPRYIVNWNGSINKNPDVYGEV